VGRLARRPGTMRWLQDTAALPAADQAALQTWAKAQWAVLEAAERCDLVRESQVRRLADDTRNDIKGQTPNL
jgi:hypothetical protein